MVAGLGVSILPILEHTVQHGGHIRVGLEDLPPGSDRTNVSLVSEAARLIRACGAELATADEVRVALRRLTDALQASGARAAST